MPEPNSSEFDGKKVDDLYIEWMLTSRDQAIRHRGLRLLDENKRMAVGGMLRRLSDDHSFNLVSDDIKDIWQEVLLIVFLNTERGTFKMSRRATFSTNGTLDKYLCTIARCAAINLMRKRNRQPPIDPGEHIDNLWRDDVRHDSLAEVHEVIMRAFEVLSLKEKLVMLCDVWLFYASGGNKHSAEDLTDEYNANAKAHGEEISNVNSVRTTRNRARKKLIKRFKWYKENRSDR